MRLSGSSWVCADGSPYIPTAIPNSANVSYNAVGAGGGNYCSPDMVLDSNDYPCITWFDGRFGNDEVFFIRWNGINWVTADNTVYNAVIGNGNVSNDSSGSRHVRVDLDNNDRPCITWTTTSWEIVFVRWNGSGWVTIDGLPYNPTTMNANVSNNGSWSARSDVKIDTNNIPHIIWRDGVGSGAEVFYVVWDGSGWVTAEGIVYDGVNANISNEGYYSDTLKLELDSKNRPHVCWLNNDTNYEVMYSKWNGVNWITATGDVYDPLESLSTNLANISKNPGDSYGISFAIDSNDVPHFSWSDDTPGNYEIFYVHLEKSAPQFSVQITDPPAVPAFCNTAEFKHRDGSVTSNEVCNTLDYDFTGTFNITKGVDTNGDGVYADNGKEVNPGDTLCYQIDWKFNNDNNDPLFGAYLYDTIPEGITYLTGAMPNDNLSYSIDGGAMWITGFPPAGTLGGTILRWGPLPSGWVGADDSPYYGAVVSQPMDINVSRSRYSSNSPELMLDSKGYPHIVWHDYTYTPLEEIFYVRWDGADWVCADGTVYDATTGNANISRSLGESRDPDIYLDSSDYPHIVWHDDGYIRNNIFYIRWNGSGWVTASGATYDTSTGNANVSNDISPHYRPKIHLDSSENPHIVWYGYPLGSFEEEVSYVKWDGTDWVIADGTVYSPLSGNANISHTPELSMYAEFDLDANDNPHVVWIDGSIDRRNYEIFYITWDGTNWVIGDGSTYVPATNNANISRNDEHSRYPDIKVDTAGNPHVVWDDISYSSGYAQILYVRGNGSDWVCADGSVYDPATGNADISMSGQDSRVPTIAIDGMGYPHVTWFDYSFDTVTFYPEIVYTRWNGMNWVCWDDTVYAPLSGSTNISNTSRDSRYPVIALDSDDLPHLVWVDESFDNQYNEIIYTHLSPTDRTFSFCVQVDEDFDCEANNPITNRASFNHAFAASALTSNMVSNTVSGCDSIAADSPYLKVSKTAEKFTYYEDEIASFKIKVSNVGSVDATGVKLFDNFPRELEFVFARPSGNLSTRSWSKEVGTLKSGESRYYEIKFRIGADVYLGEGSLILENIAVATCNETDKATDSAVISVRKKVGTERLHLDVTWTGIDTKTSIGESGTEITLDMVVGGGSSPYEIMVDWGDDEKSFISEIMHTAKATHTYGSAGEYKVIIKLTDMYGKTLFVERILTIK